MKLFDVYPLYDINVVKGKDARYGTTRDRNTWTSTAGTPSSA